VTNSLNFILNAIEVNRGSIRFMLDICKSAKNNTNSLSASEQNSFGSAGSGENSGNRLACKNNAAKFTWQKIIATRAV